MSSTEAAPFASRKAVARPANGGSASPMSHVGPDFQGSPVIGGLPGSSATVDQQLVVHLRGVRRAFGSRRVLDGIDLDIRAGEFVSLLGRSGSGKSTLLRALDGFDHDVSGHIEVPEQRAVVYQDARLLPWARVLDNVVLGLRRRQASARGRRVLEEVGLASHERAWPVTLSGGEAQRAALARALVRDPHLLLLDEPFGALDALTRITMHGLLRSLCDRYSPAVLLVTHDVNEAITLSDRILILDEGKLVYDAEVLLAKPREPHHDGFATLRERLHAQLGVTSESGAVPAQKT
jgi:sulfonate transport system ATP-binding protein